MKYRYVGILEPKLANKLGITEHKNKPILVFEDRIHHVIENHINDFGSLEKIRTIYDKLSNIIKKPDYVFYNKVTKGIEYYKNIDGNVCVAVRVKPGKTLKVKSWYPVNSSKSTNRKKKEREETLYLSSIPGLVDNINDIRKKEDWNKTKEYNEYEEW